MTIIGEAFVKVGSLVDSFEADLKRKLEPAARAAGESLTKDLGSSLESVGGTLTDRLTKPAAAVAAAGQVLFQSWHRGFEIIAQDTGEVGAALEGLVDSAERVARRVTVPFADVAAVLSEVRIRSKLTGEPLEELTQQIIELSEVTRTDAAGNVELLMKLLGGWRVPTLQQAGALDLLYRASQRTGNGIQQIASSALGARVFLQGLGFTFEDTIALTARLGAAFPKVMAGLKIGIANLSKAGVEDIPTAFAEVVDSINSAGSAAEGNRVAIETFGSRAGPYMAALIREGKLEFQDFAEELRNGQRTIHDTAEETRTWTDRLIMLRNAVVGNIGPIGEWSSIIASVAAGAGPLFVGLGKAIGPPIRAIQELRRYSVAVEAPLTAMGAAVELTKIQLTNGVGAARNFVGGLNGVRIAAGLAKGAIIGFATFALTELISNAGEAEAAAARLGDTLRQGLGTGGDAAVRSMALFERKVDQFAHRFEDTGAALAESWKFWDPTAEQEIQGIRADIEQLRESAVALDEQNRRVTLSTARWQEATLNLALAQNHAQTSSEDLARLRAEQASAAAAVVAAYENLNTSTDENSDSETRNTDATEGGIAADRRRTLTLRDIRNAHREAAAAAREQVSAELSLAQGLLGIQGSALGIADAEQRLADARFEVFRLERAGRTGTDRYREAVNNLRRAQLDAVGGQLSMAQSVASYIDEQRRGGATHKTAAELVREYGDMAGLTGSEIERLIGEVEGLIGKYDELPAGKTTDVNFEDEIARRKIARLKRELASIPREVNIQTNVNGGSSAVAPGTFGPVPTVRMTPAMIEANERARRRLERRIRRRAEQTVVVIDGRKVQESNNRRRVLLEGA